MFSLKSLAAATLLSGLAIATAPLCAGVTLTASTASIKILGKSTLHGWEANAGSVTISAVAASVDNGVLGAINANGVSKLDVAVSVDSLKSTESSGMDKNMHNDLESDKFPQITFSLKSYAVSGLTVTAQGDLTIHGVTKPVTLVGGVQAKGDAVSVSGSYPLLMSDYGVKPPVMMFGTVKVADQVSINYDFKLAK